LAVHNTNGMMKLPKGIKNLLKVDACMIADKFLSCFDKVSVMAYYFLIQIYG